MLYVFTKWICRIAGGLVFVWASYGFGADYILDHEVVLDAQGRLQPWTSYDQVIQWSVNFILHCPTTKTKFGQDPWYLVTAKFNEDGQFLLKQNNQGNNVYWAMETAKRYYAYTGDPSFFAVVRRLLDRILHYRTPADWVWPGVPRTQDDSPDGEYTDDWSEPDKMCLVAIACLDFFKYNGEKKYLRAAREIAATVARHVRPGDADHSPLPFRVHLQSGRVLDPYNAGIISAVKLFDEIRPFVSRQQAEAYSSLRDRMMQWILQFPMINHYWSGYYEDVVSQEHNLNQHTPMETARYLLQHPELDPDFQEHVPALCAWVENRFGRTKHYGATSIREQDSCFMEMSSHTARYASVVARWYGYSGAQRDFEEARAAFALATYSAYNRYSRDGRAINYVGIGYADPWFSDSYFDYLPHLFDGLAEIPAMMTHSRNCLLQSTSVIRRIDYEENRIRYTAFNDEGAELLHLVFRPRVLADGKPLDCAYWQFGEYRGSTHMLRIRRAGAKHIEIVAE
ncbi:hypothetical protein GX408_06475 [bacterium]|nr:hypothetical protein [bacterium]